MTKILNRAAAIVFCLSVVFLSSYAAWAQQEKGNKEVLLLSSSFFIDVDESRFTPPAGSGGAGFTSSGRGFNIGGKLGYFLTRKHEVGGGLSLALNRFKFCTVTFSDGRIIEESCDGNTNFSLGLSGFYRYNFAGRGRKGFPFIGADIAVADVSNNFTGNFRVRPHAGYKYFLSKKVALDFSVGYSADLNKAGDDFGFFRRERIGRIDGQLGLAFVF